MTNSELDELVVETYGIKDGLKPILDGIINESIYNSGIPKILWILKEPYDSGDGLGGWDSRIDIDKNAETYFAYRTWKKIAYCSYGIINNVSYEKAKEESKVFESLRSIAYINLSKIPAETTSPNRWKYFEKVYGECKSVLWDQIKNYSPDIIIIGNLTYIFLPDFNLTWEDGILSPLMGKPAFTVDDKIIIDAYHPSSFSQVTEADYCNSIINTATDWLASK